MIAGCHGGTTSEHWISFPRTLPEERINLIGNTGGIFSTAPSLPAAPHRSALYPAMPVGTLQVTLNSS